MAQVVFSSGAQSNLGVRQPQVGVKQHDAMPLLRQGGGQVDGDGGLPNPSLAAGNANDFSFSWLAHVVPPFCWAVSWAMRAEARAMAKCKSAVAASACGRGK